MSQRTAPSTSQDSSIPAAHHAFGAVAEAMLRALPDAALLLDREQLIRSCNRHAEVLFGTAAADILGLPIFQAFHLEMPLEAGSVDRCLATGGVWRGPASGCANGSAQIEWLLSPFDPGAGGPAGVLAIARAVCRDATESAPDSLCRDTEDRLRLLIDTMPDFVCFKDGEGRWIEANVAALRMFELSGIDFKGKRDLELAEESAFCRDALRACEASDEIAWGSACVSRGEERVPRPDGTCVVLDIRKIPVFHPDGRRKGLVVFGQDVSESRRLEDIQREFDARFRALFHNSPLTAVLYRLIYDEAGEIVDWELTDINARGAQVIGKTPEEVIGKRATVLFGPEQMAGYLELSRQVRKDGQPRQFETYFEWNDAWYLSSVFLVGKDHYANVSTDMSAIKRAENALRASEQKYRLLADNMADVVWTMDLAGRFSYISPSVLQFRGYTTEEAMQEPLEHMLTPDSAVVVRKILTDVATGVIDEPTTVAEIQQTCKDGSLVWVEVLARWLRDESGRVVGALGCSRDITRRKIAEQTREALEVQLRQAQKMEALGTLAGGVAHDFNNLLMVINTCASFCIDALEPSNPVRKDVQEILRAGELAAKLTRQLLAFGRKQVMQLRDISINAVVGGMGDMLRRLVGEHINFRVELSDDIGATRADPHQLEQVLLNLVTNAREAMPGGGTLALSTANVEVDALPVPQSGAVRPGPYVRLSVADTGCGMDALTVERVFEPFFTTKEAGKGTGLGLAMVYGVVRQTGGAISVFSEPGKGTRFEVLFPRTLGPIQPVSVFTAADMVAGGTESILVVEDDDAVRDVVDRILGMAGYRVLAVSHAAAALAICAQPAERIDLVITDVVMPDIGGREFADRLALLRPAVTVLFMSGYTDDAILRHGVIEEGTPFIQKPFLPRALAAKVRTLLDEKRLSDAV